MKLSALILLLLIFAVWAYFGFPSPVTLLNWTSAEEECIKFAEKHKGQLFFSSNQQIRAVSSGLKHGKIVVEVGAFRDDEDTYMPRICVVSGDRIEIVSILESGAWR